MPNPNLTLITVVLDKSGSMAHLVNDTINGLNTFLTEQKALPGDVRFTMTQFGSGVNTTHDYVDLRSMGPLTREDYVPNGWTAMYDGIGSTIDSVGAKLAAMPENERPGKVVVVIQTDGQENSSRRYNLTEIKNKVEHQQSTYNWQFIFLGANQDAVLAGRDFGISGSNSLTYSASGMGVNASLRSVSNVIGSYRVSSGVGGQSVRAFTKEQRQEAVATTPPTTTTTSNS